MTEIESVLVIGNNVRHIVASAKRAGFYVVAADKYRDADLFLYADEVASLKEAPALANEVDGIVLGSGYETYNIGGNILGNNPTRAKEVVDKRKLWKKLDNLGFVQPEIVKELEKEEWGVLKPRVGSGGSNSRIVHGNAFNGKKLGNEWILQSYVTGTPCSVCVISNEDSVAAVSVNRQLIGVKWLGQKNPLGYCGNLSPFLERLNELSNLGEEVVESLSLVGCNGVDIIMGDQLYVVEVNPRFQGSLDSIEMAYQTNLFNLHVKACQGERIERQNLRDYVMFSARGILFTEKSGVVKRDFLGHPNTMDVPLKDSKIEAGNPVISVVVSDYSEKKAMDKLKIIAGFFRETIFR